MYEINNEEIENVDIVVQKEGAQILPEIMALLEKKEHLFFVVSQDNGTRIFAFTEHLQLVTKMLANAKKNNNKLIGIYAVGKLF